MAAAARLLEKTNHPGFISGPGATKTLINKLPAVRVTDKHTCLLPPTAGPHPPSAIVKGSTSVLIEGQPAARQGDTVGCGASIISGSLDVLIGG
jgi:uncharacterized Zn-binding protein involved in type VI secretion